MLNCVGLKKVLQDKCAHLWIYATKLKNNLKYDGFTVNFYVVWESMKQIKNSWYAYVVSIKQ